MVSSSTVFVTPGKTIFRKSHGLLHSIGKPAIEHPDGTLEYYKDGKRHRDGDLPAVIINGGVHEYWQNGVLHRNDGLPAVVWPNGECEYWEQGLYKGSSRLDIYEVLNERRNRCAT